MSWLSDYLREIGDIRSSGDATEMSYRLALGKMLSAAAADVAAESGKFGVLHEPRRGAGGAPDFRIDGAGGGIVGYVECKKPGEDLPRLVGKAQLRRYAALSPNILLTDGWRWLLLREGRQAGDIMLPQSGGAPPAGARRDFAELLRSFFAAPADGVGDAKTLAARLATRCDILRRELAHVVGDDEGRLRDLRDAFKAQIYHDMEDEEFADAFAQTTTYSLLMAKLRAGDEVELALDSARRRIPQSFALIRELSGFLGGLDDDYPELRWVVDDILALVNNMDVAAITETISRTQTAGMDGDDDDPFTTHFYENFLAAYDARLRKSRGVYYTPLPVVRFIVRAVDDILKSDFGKAKGLADKDVTSLDFAAGTGAFMQEAMRQALNGKSLAERRLLAKDRLLPNCHGFEFMIAPYVIAHLKLSQFLEDQGCGIDKNANEKTLKVILTDTLEEAAEQARSVFLPALSKEAEIAGDVKSKSILAIMGNPPYSGHSQTASKRIVERDHKKIQGKRVKVARDTWIGELMKTYYVVDGKPLGERNPKWLQDDYVKFIRFAQHKMENVDRGVVAVITNHAFLDNPTFRGMRQSLFNAFDRLYFLDLHGNSKKREKAVDGGKDKNVFDIQQGVCVSLMVKNPALSPGVFHCDVWGDRAGKYDFCLSHAVGDAGADLQPVEWKKLQPETPFYLFIPYDKKAARKFQSYHSVKDIFPVNNVGIITARDKLTIAFDKEEIRARAREFAAMPPEEARERFSLGRDARDWSVERAQRDLRESGLAEENFRRIMYRPFDARHTCYTGASSGFHCNPRRKIMSHMLRDNIGLVTVRQVADQFNHALVVDGLMDIRITSVSNKGVGYLFPMWTYREDMGKVKKEENLSPKFREWLDERYQRRFSVAEVMSYVYAVLHSPDYRRRYADSLRLDFPRVPFPASSAEFERLSGIGGRLIGAHLLRDESLPLTADLRGDGEDAPIENPRHDGDKLHINKGAYFAPVSAEVFAFRIGGYRPLDKYLKERKGRKLTLEDMETVRKTAAAIAFTIKAMQEIGPVG